ncbi:MAG: MarR family winged helix-turn-helix transcriptional regulator [Pseudomonadota bacterium]
MDQQRCHTRTEGEQLTLADFLPYRLSVLSNTISEHIADAYRREFDLSVSQWRVIAVLFGDPGLSAKEVSQRTAMDKVAVSRAVSKLIEQGRLKRKSAQNDGRLSTLHLTAAGKAVYTSVAPKALAFEKKLISELSTDDRAAISRILGKLSKAVSPDHPLW